MSQTVTQEDLKKILNQVLPPDNVDYIVSQGTDGIWTYRKWNNGVAECWGRLTVASRTYAQNGYYQATTTLPSGLFVSGSNPVLTASCGISGNIRTNIGYTFANATSVETYIINTYAGNVTAAAWVCWYLIGNWK